MEFWIFWLKEWVWGRRNSSFFSSIGSLVIIDFLFFLRLLLLKEPENDFKSLEQDAMSRIEIISVDNSMGFGVKFTLFLERGDLLFSNKSPTDKTDDCSYLSLDIYS